MENVKNTPFLKKNIVAAVLYVWKTHPFDTFLDTGASEYDIILLDCTLK